MSSLGAALRVWLKVVDRRIRRAAEDPVAAQRRVFDHLIQKGRNTWFGRRYGFGRIRTPDDFAAAVPIADYVGRLDMFHRILAGERDVSWPGRVRLFAQTSGTTAGDKRVPLTREMMRANRRAAMRIFAYYDRREGVSAAGLFGGQLLFLGGSTDLTRTESGALIGDLSGIATRSIVWPVSRHYEPGEELALLDDWEEKVERIARRTVDRDVRFV
ncbi:MAG: GH3 family domain-containing protein, partial [Planctomycetota bacterium]